MSVVASSLSAQGIGLVPTLRYRDVEAASSWLQYAFGFEESRVIRDVDGKVRFAQLAHGGSMIMLCPLGGSAFDAYMAQPEDGGGRETQVCYVFVPDAEEHKVRALAAGAEMVLDLDAGDGKGQGYSCRDPEGHIWSFGTYDPWRHTRGEMASEGPTAFTRFKRAAMLAGLAVAAVAASAGAFNWINGPQNRASSALAGIENVLEKPSDLASAERLLRQAREELVRERAQRMQAERQGQDMKELALRERDARTGAEKAVREARAIIPADGAVVKSDATTSGVPPTPVKVGNADAVRTASVNGGASEEIRQLKLAVERAQAELRQERQTREVRAGTVTELQSQVEKEKAAREQAERQMREALARVSRIEGVRKADVVPRNPTPGYYKDLNRKVFPLSAVTE